MRTPTAAFFLIIGGTLLPLRGIAESAGEESFAVHGQFTYVEQETNRFNPPYRGANSLSRNIGAETTDATLFLGARLWGGAEAWLNPEVDQGRGLDNTLGAAGFPSGEAYKVGKNQPYLRLPRAFVRQTLNLGDDAEPVDPAANQLATVRSSNHLVLTVGKFGVGDVFDTNQYAHDPRNDYLNWSAIDTGTFDYAADAWGYTVGAALEWYAAAWTVRGGLFDLSDVPNSAHLEPGLHEYQYDVEVEHRHSLNGRSGRMALTIFDSHGRMGLLNEAVDRALSTGTAVDIAAVRRFRDRAGISLTLEQQLVDGVGAFVRAGRAAGNVEAYEFTDIDRTVAAGIAVDGGWWHRPGDVYGLAGIVNGISAERERYLDAGGLGILVGDGRLPHPASEQIIETYYSLAMLRYAHVSVDYQRLTHPAYNRDRGPVAVFAVRFHAQF